MKSIQRVASLALSLALLLLLAGGSVGVAVAAGGDDPGERQFSQAEIFLELNDTDGDLGLHADIDGEPWTQLDLTGPRGRRLLRLTNHGSLRNQGLTQLSFESAEPPFDELAPEVFFRRFPKGTYELEARTLDGAELEGEAELSHVLPAPVSGVFISGVEAAEDCDVDPLPSVSAPVVITWDPVTESHPEIGESGDVEISRYQLFVETEGMKFSINLPPTTTEFTVPSEVTEAGTRFKWEIIARHVNGNNTAVESCYVVD